MPETHAIHFKLVKRGEKGEVGGGGGGGADIYICQSTKARNRRSVPWGDNFNI